MCGRFTLPLSPAEIQRLLELNRGLDPDLAALAGRYNIAPDQPVLAAVQPEPAGERRAVALRWGLVPAWARDPALGRRLINARSETVSEKPAFREAFRHRRCLVPAGGFYEWEKGGSRRPWYFHPREERGIVLAGLWERWEPPGGGAPLLTCTLLTTEANPLVARVHGRMPVILPPEACTAWLTTPPAEADDLKVWLHPCPAETLAGYPVSRAVNDPRHEGPDCVTPAGGTPGTLF